MTLTDDVAADPPFHGKAGWIGIPLRDGTTLPAYRAEPAGAALAPVLLAHDIFGMRAFYEALARRLATAGFAVLVPDFFFRQGAVPDPSIETAVVRRTRLDEKNTLVDLATALAWLRHTPEYHGRIGTLGFCMGGTFVLDLCASETDLVTVSFYGFPVPQATLAMPPPRPMDLVARMKGPILAIWGEHDAYIRAEDMREFAARGAAAGVDLDVRILEGLGHSFFTAETARDAAAARRATESWHDGVRFLQQHLVAAPNARA